MYVFKLKLRVYKINSINKIIKLIKNYNQKYVIFKKLIKPKLINIKNRNKKYNLLRSPHINKQYLEHFIFQIKKRLIFIENQELIPLVFFGFTLKEIQSTSTLKFYI